MLYFRQVIWPEFHHRRSYSLRKGGLRLFSRFQSTMLYDPKSSTLVLKEQNTKSERWSKKLTHRQGTASKCVIDCWGFTVILPAQRLCVISTHMCGCCTRVRLCGTAEFYSVWIPLLDPSMGFPSSQTWIRRQLAKASSWIRFQTAAKQMLRVHTK